MDIWISFLTSKKSAFIFFILWFRSCSSWSTNYFFFLLLLLCEASVIRITLDKICHLNQAITFILCAPKPIMRAHQNEIINQAPLVWKTWTGTACCFLSSKDFITSAFLMPKDKTCWGNNVLPNVLLHKVCVKRGLSSLLTKLGFTVLISVNNTLYHRHFTSVTLHDVWFDSVYFLYIF